MLMAVMMPRENWTDERLDERFGRLDADTRELRGDIKDLRTEMNARFDAMRESIDARFDAVNRNMMAGFLMVIVTILGSNAF
jgi:chromosome segregation ATPase